MNGSVVAGAVRFKAFPPGWNHVLIPTTSRESARAALTLYAPCARKGILGQRLAWWIVTLVGPTALPGRARSWVPPVGTGYWEELSAAWGRALGAFDTFAIYQRTQRSRAGMSVLLLNRGRPLAFVKLRGADDAKILSEECALNAVHALGVRSFWAPEPLASGTVGGWRFLAVTPIPPQLHREPRQPALELICEEIDAALGSLPRPLATPEHWRPMHGDFTPWNLRTSGGRTLLLDWEDAAWGPPGADLVYYHAALVALHGGRVVSLPFAEAVRFWQQRLRVPSQTTRDDRLISSLTRALEESATHA